MRERFKTLMLAAAIGAAASAGFVGTAAQAASGPGYDDPNNWPQYHRSHNAWPSARSRRSTRATSRT